jgi:Predicted enzyme of the cupin superfamily
MTFRRVGVSPGAKPELESVPWQDTDVPVSEGMVPLGHTYYTDRSGRVTSGIWACNAGNVEIRNNPVEEICFVTKGTVKVTDSYGRSETFGPGECLALPRGFNGIWSQSDDFAKFYVLVE